MIDDGSSTEKKRCESWYYFSIWTDIYCGLLINEVQRHSIQGKMQEML